MKNIIKQIYIFNRNHEGGICSSSTQGTSWNGLRREEHKWGRGWVKGGNTAIGQPHQTKIIYDYTDKLKLYNFQPFLLFLDDLERVPDITISDHSFQPITVCFSFVLLKIVPIFLRTSSMFSFFFFGTMALFLMIPFVPENERSFPA